MSKHTKGPWKTADKIVCLDLDSWESRRYLNVVEIIATFKSHQGGPDRHKVISSAINFRSLNHRPAQGMLANARLMAAAPTMAEALIHAREDLVTLGAEDSDVCGILNEIDFALRMAGLTKTKGEQQ